MTFSRRGRGIVRGLKSKVAVGGLILATVAAGCGSTASGNQTSNKSPYLIGSTSDLSGVLAFEGSGLRDGINAWVTYTNAHGGINGHPISYTPLDDKSNPTTGLANAKELAGSGAIAILGWGLSDVIQGAMPALQQSGMPIIAQSLTAQMLNPPNKLIYGGDFTIAGEAAPEVAFAKSLLQKNGVTNPKVAIIGYVSAVDEEFISNAKALISQNGWTLTTTQVVQLSDTDISTAVNAIVNTKPDIVISSLIDPQVLLLDKGMRAAGDQAPIVNYDGGSAFGSLKAAADPNLYFLRPYGYGTDTAAGIATFDAAAKAVGADPEAPFVINGYAQGLALGAALKACGFPCTRSSLASALNRLGTLDTGGVTVAPMVFDSSTHQGVQSGVMYAWNTTANKPEQMSQPLPVKPQ